MRSRQPWFVEDDDDYWNELHNRLTRYLEELELLRERVSLVLEAENQRLAERMTLFLYGLSFLVGLFLRLSVLLWRLGSIVGCFPGAESPLGFFVACGLMILLALGQLLLFRRWRWL